MPKHEPVVAQLTPRVAEAPIPVRVISTRAVPRPAPEQTQTVQQPIVEETSKEEIALPPQASAKARQEQAYRQREAVLKQREQDLADKLALADKYSQLETKVKAKDFSALETLGADYDEYTQWKINKAEGEDPAQKPILELKAEVEALKKSQEENVTKEYEATVAEYRKEIVALVEKDENFSSIKALEQQDAVLQLILDSWEEDNEMLTVEEAAKDIEDYLTEEARKMAALPKVKTTTERPLPKPGLKTLTQQVIVGADKASPQKPLSQLPESERYAEARRRALAKRQG